MIAECLIVAAVAAFAVFGLICAVKMLVDFWFPLKQVAVTVEVQTKEDADVLEMLMNEARSAFFRKGGTRLVVLLAEELTEDGEIPEAVVVILERYGAECYLVG